MPSIDFDLFALNDTLGGEPIANPFGCVLDPSESYRVNSLLPHPRFADVAADLRGTGAAQDVFLWEQGEVKALGRLLDSYKQTLGTCVSQGWGRAAQDLQAIQAAKRQGVWKNIVATEPIYAGSRIEVGKGRLGNDEGSLGSWAAKWVSDWGILLREIYAGHDLTMPDDQLAQRWGTSREGVPGDIEDDAKEHPIKSVAVCESFEQACDAIANLYPVPVASNQGFAIERTNDGFCRPQGSWAHQMLFRGCGVARGNKPFLVCQNSWGDYLSGNETLTLESGKDVRLPAGAFAVDAPTANKMLRQGDSHAASNFVGFPRQRPDFDLFPKRCIS